MTYKITVLDDGTTKIEIDFSDEGVNLKGETTVKGGEVEALNYLPIFEEDLRRNYSELFPKPEPELTIEGMMI
ncbi:hypothetical protein [Caldanaerobacter subterraneus]|uniref:Uncharacterized protein n=1 Tax=Caldanaerobacter subterraneus TaxID=911092 RepID=A0A7Y2PLJ6_9THEO|nr:hypothetical protein [Caldanaerobacter subterraneus]NNG67356.1 hypothetical protein [Caldanaerobacter subterraneus]